MKNKTDLTVFAPHADTVRGDGDALLALPLNAAVHAAGHAVVSLVAGAPFDRVTVRHDPAGNWTGCTSPPPGLMPRGGHWQGEASIILGGPAAQLELLTRIATGDRAGNIAAIRARNAVEFEDVATLNVDELRAETLALSVIRHWWPAVLTLTKAILEAPDSTLTDAQCVALVGTRVTGIATQAHQRHVRTVQRQYAGGLERMCSNRGEVSDLPARTGADGAVEELDLAA